MTEQLDAFQRYQLFLGYLLFFAVVIMGFIYVDNNQKVFEERTIANEISTCQQQNEMKLLLARVLDQLAEPRLDDEPGEFEHRMELRRQLDPLVALHTCPFEGQTEE